MAAIKLPLQISCPNCKQGNQPGSPYCSRCGAPLSELPPETISPDAAAPLASRDNSLTRFLSEGQDPTLVKQSYDRAFAILTTGESIEYIAIAGRGSLAHSPDCVVATDKRIMLFRKKMLGKYELDDCYWRDVRHADVTEGKNGITLSLEAIQGWHITVEALPKAQAWRINEIAMQRSERLHNSTNSGFLANAVQASTEVAPAPHAPAIQTNAHPNAMQVAKEVFGSTQLPARSVQPMLDQSGQQSAPATVQSAAPASPSPERQSAWESETKVEPVPLVTPTPESVLQSILQQTQGASEGAPTRPIQFAAAAFQAPAIADTPPVTMRETTTDPHMRPAPPMPTLEQIAVFSGPLAFNHAAPGEISTPLDGHPISLSDSIQSQSWGTDNGIVDVGTRAEVSVPAPAPEMTLVPLPTPAPSLSLDVAEPESFNTVSFEPPVAVSPATPNKKSQSRQASSNKGIDFDTPLDVANVIGYMLPGGQGITSGPLPLPGSQTSGPLLAADPGSSTDTVLFSQFSDQISGTLSTQQLYYDPSAASDLDRPTDINLGQYVAQGTERGKSGKSSAGAASQRSSKGQASASSSRSSQSKAAADDPINKMKQLKMLLDSGFITEADYEAKKADILARFF